MICSWGCKKGSIPSILPLVGFLPGWWPTRLQLLCLVGEAFDDYSDDVCGAVVNVRAKGDKIAIWTANYENRDAVTHIGWDVFHFSAPVTPAVMLTLMLTLFQESLQGTPGPSHEDDNWLPVSCRHSHKERLHHQEQICGLKRANVPLPFPRLICCRCILFTLRKAIWRTQQSRTSCQVVPEPPRDMNRKRDLPKH